MPLMIATNTTTTRYLGRAELIIIIYPLTSSSRLDFRPQSPLLCRSHTATCKASDEANNGSSHKLPEGFITYATNHANPKLGFTVFLALAIHNVTEGFALALPLYLATNSRIRALLYSIVLGGLSQPLGAGIAALWLHFAEKGRGDQNQTDKQQAVYGVMFALTAGIMTSVAFGLMLEGTQLGHNKTLAVTFIFIGAFILGASSALTG